MISKLIGWVKRLFAAAQSGDFSGAADVLNEATALYTAYAGIADLPEEARAAFKEGADVFIAIGKVAVAVQGGALPTKADIDKLQSERVEADMAFGKLISTLPTQG